MFSYFALEYERIPIVFLPNFETIFSCLYSKVLTRHFSMWDHTCME